MLKTLIKGGLAGGIIIFIWSALSWMVIPWHMATLNSFKNETAIIQAINDNAPQSGIYLMPIQENTASQDLIQHGPLLFASIHHGGMTPMGLAMVIELVVQIISAILVTWLLMKTSGLSYLGKVGFVYVFALVTSISTNLPYWLWFNFSVGFTLVAIADVIIAWTLAGFAIAKIVDNAQKRG